MSDCVLVTFTPPRLSGQNSTLMGRSTHTPTLCKGSGYILERSRSNASANDVGGRGRSLPIEERLIQKQREYDLRALERQREREAKESGQGDSVTYGTPRINRRSQNIVGRGDVSHRLYTHALRSATPNGSCCAHNMTTEEREASTLSFTPTINARSRGMHRTAEQREAWAEQREASVLWAQSHATTNAAEVSGKPKLNEISRRIVENIRNSSPSSQRERRVEDRLLDAQAAKMEKLRALKESRDAASSNGSNRKTYGDTTATFERLHAEHQHREVRMRSHRENVLRSQSPNTFRPKINKNADSAARCGSTPTTSSVFEHLYQMAANTECRRRRVDAHPDETWHPNIRGYTRRLGEMRGTHYSDPRRQATDKSEQPTFKPQINSHSAQLDSVIHGSSPSQRLARLATRPEQQDAQRRRLAHEKDLKEQRECTFTPRTTRYVPEASSEVSLIQCDVVSRNNDWERRRQLRLQKEREARQDVGLEECTFRPSTNTRTVKASVNSS